jgi:hypothetical protein
MCNNRPIEIKMYDYEGELEDTEAIEKWIKGKYNSGEIEEE